jgi:hypothetical protein
MLLRPVEDIREGPSPSISSSSSSAIAAIEEGLCCCAFETIAELSLLPLPGGCEDGDGGGGAL